MPALARAHSHQIARPLKILIPLIQGELQMGDTAGHDHYVAAGRMLNEARDQVAHGGWGRWIAKNFDLSQTTAGRYMRWAHQEDDFDHGVVKTRHSSLRAMEGTTEREREERQSKQQKAFRSAMADIARDDFVQERQAHKDEVQLHRELAEELIDLGYRALATRLHPDRGGTKDAMTRLNRVRDELKSVAAARRFI